MNPRTLSKLTSLTYASPCARQVQLTPAQKMKEITIEGSRLKLQIVRPLRAHIGCSYTL